MILVIENNQYGEGTPVDKQHNVANLSDQAEAYGVLGITIDGMDVTGVYEAFDEARDRVLNGDGPSERETPEG